MIKIPCNLNQTSFTYNDQIGICDSFVEMYWGQSTFGVNNNSSIEI